MKLKRKLIGLSLLVSALTSFCVFGNVAKAAPKVSSAVAKRNLPTLDKNIVSLRQHSYENGVRLDELTEKAEKNLQDLEERIDALEQYYYEKNLDKSAGKPIFAATVGVSEKGSDHNFMTVFCSPTQLIAEYPSLEKDLKNAVLTYEIEDSNGAIYRFNRDRQLSFIPRGDYLLMIFPSASSVPEERRVYGDKVHFDANFKTLPGEEYKIRLYDSSGELVGEESFVPKKFDSACPSLPLDYEKDRIAHPPEFNREYYRHYYLRSALGSVVGETAVASNKSVDLASSSSCNFAASKPRGSAKALSKSARNRVKSSRAVSSVSLKSKKSDDDSYEKIERRLDADESGYYEKGLHKTQNKPVFYVQVDDSKNVNVSDRDATLYFSPTWLMKLKPSIKNFEKLTFEIVDEEGHVYRRKYKSLVPVHFFDLMFVYLPSVRAAKEEVSDYLTTFDKGFKFEVGKEYKIKVLDSKNSLVVEDSCIFSKESDLECNNSNIAKCVVHPPKFNRNYYKESFLNYRSNFKRVQ